MTDVPDSSPRDDRTQATVPGRGSPSAAEPLEGVLRAQLREADDLAASSTARGTAGWTAEQHVTYLDGRPGAAWPYNPAAEYGDQDWREPASDAEAAARAAWLAENTSPASGMVGRPLTEVEDAVDDAQERAVLSDRAHDPDPSAWAEYDRLVALDQLAPLATDRDALDDLTHDDLPDESSQDRASSGQDGWQLEDRVLRDYLADEAALAGRSRTGGSEGEDGPFIDPQGRRWASTGPWAAGTCDPAKATDTTQPDDIDRLRRRLEDLRSSAPHNTRRTQGSTWTSRASSGASSLPAGTMTTPPPAATLMPVVTGRGGRGDPAPPQQPSGGHGGGEFARVEALAGLAREVDGLRRGLETLVDIPTRLDDLARTVAQLADAVAATPARPSPTVAMSWLAAPADSDALAAMLGELASWLHRVFLRYPDGVAVLPECWLGTPTSSRNCSG